VCDCALGQAWSSRGKVSRSLQLSSSTDELILSEDDSEVDEVVERGRGSLEPVSGWGDQSWGAGKVERWKVARIVGGRGRAALEEV